MLNTKRLRIYPASREQMEAMIASEQDEELKKAYSEMLEGCLRHPDQWDWYAIWMIEKTDGTHIGDFLIKRGVTHKTIILSAILLAACLLLSGCGGKSAFDGSRIFSETVFRMEYSILDREESAEMMLTEGDQIQVHISHTAGNVDVIVGENGEEPIYKGTEQENADFILTVPKTGCYHISVTGHRAKGEISFSRIPLKEE